MNAQDTLTVHQLLGRIVYFHSVFIEPGLTATDRPRRGGPACCRHSQSTPVPAPVGAAPVLRETAWAALGEIAATLPGAVCPAEAPDCCPTCQVLAAGQAIAACWIDVEHTAYGVSPTRPGEHEAWSLAVAVRLAAAFSRQHSVACIALDGATSAAGAAPQLPAERLPLTGELFALWADPTDHTPVTSWLNHCTGLPDIAQVLGHPEGHPMSHAPLHGPIHIAETLAVGSIEGFLTPAEMADLTEIMACFLAGDERSAFAERRTASIHEVPGHTTAQAMAVYEPAGRVEVPEIPTAAEDILQRAFDRARPALARLIPSVTTCRPWTYVEYGPGQYITAHLDGIAPDPMAWPRQIAGISIVIGEPSEGGGFYVETASDERLWNTECSDPASGYSDGMWLARDGADHSADWFRAMPRTRWSVNATPGTALLYGSQLTHGTHPVVGGTARKFISWLIAEHR